MTCTTPRPTSLRPRSVHIRDALGPQVPAWLHRLGATMTTPAVIGPAGDTPDACLAALGQAQATGADIILTTGGTMRGPVDQLRGALRELGARYLVDTVQVRPGSPMLLATLTSLAGGSTLMAGLPGQPAVRDHRPAHSRRACAGRPGRPVACPTCPPSNSAHRSRTVENARTWHWSPAARTGGLGIRWSRNGISSRAQPGPRCPRAVPG